MHDGFIATWLVPRDSLPAPGAGLTYEAVVGNGDTALSVCFLRQPISPRANPFTIPQLAFRVPVLADGRPASLLLTLLLPPILARLAGLLTGLPTQSARLDLGSPYEGENRWAATTSRGQLVLRAGPGPQPSPHPSLAGEHGFERLLAQRATVVLARGRIRHFAVSGGLGCPVPARAILESQSLLEAIVLGVDDWPGRLVAAWSITPTAPVPVRAEQPGLAAEPC